MPFLNGSEPPIPYSERKLQSGTDDAPWPLEDLVLGQQMHCAGAELEAIAAELGRGVDDVRRTLEPGGTGLKKSVRPERANMGFAAFKERR